MSVDKLVESHLGSNWKSINNMKVNNYIEKVYVDVSRVRHDFPEKEIDMYLVYDLGNNSGILVSTCDHKITGPHYIALMAEFDSSHNIWRGKYSGVTSINDLSTMSKSDLSAAIKRAGTASIMNLDLESDFK
jgi:hypothetical protein